MEDNNIIKLQEQNNYKTPKIVQSYSFNHLGNNQENGNSNFNHDLKNEEFQNSQFVNKNNNNHFGVNSNNGIVNNKEDDLKQTLKRDRPKINSHKLPSAFVNFNNTSKKNKIVFNYNQSNRENGNNIIRQIDDMVDINEYKIIKNQLSPIKNDKKKNVKQQKQSSNPLGPFRRYMANYSKVNEEMSSQQEFSMERVNQLAVVGKQNQLKQNEKSSENINIYQQSNQNLHYVGNQLQSRLKLEEMITLGLMKGNRYTGLIKKMMHAPTLQLYAVKEEPINNKEVRNNLKEWINFWQNSFQDSELHVKIYGSFWNTPEGCVSILLEHVGGGSLQNLLESLGCLNERALKEICQQILGSLQILHQEHQMCHGSLNPSQILFTREGNVKLSLGIQYRVNPNSLQFGCLGKVNDRMSLYDPSTLQTPSLFKQSFLEKGGLKCDKTDKQEDIFKFGLMILVSAIGNLDIIDNYQQFLDNIKAIFEEYQKNSQQYLNLCCIIHSEKQITNWKNIKIQNIQNQEDHDMIFQNSNSNIDLNQNNITINTMIDQGRLSQDFINFICQCTQFNNNKRLDVEELLQHPFITQRNLQNKSPKIYLRDLVKISNQWSQQQHLPVEFQGQSEKQLNRLVDAMGLVLPNCEKWFNNQQYSDYTKHIWNLKVDSQNIEAISNDLGIDPQIVYSKIMSVYSQSNLIKNNQLQQSKNNKKYFM